MRIETIDFKNFVKNGYESKLDKFTKKLNEPASDKFVYSAFYFSLIALLLAFLQIGIDVGVFDLPPMIGGL